MKKRFDSPEEFGNTDRTPQYADTQELRILNNAGKQNKLEKKEEMLRKIYEAADLLLEALTELAINTDPGRQDVVAHLSLREGKFKRLKSLAINHSTESRAFVQELLMCQTVVKTMIIEYESEKNVVSNLIRANTLLSEVFNHNQKKHAKRNSPRKDKGKH